MRCELHRRAVVSSARSERVSSASRRHIERCLRCQAAVARERKMLRQLRGYGSTVEPPTGLVDRILLSLEQAADQLEQGGDRQPSLVGRWLSDRSRSGRVAGAVAMAVAVTVGLSSRRVRRIAGLAS